jgi:hypothetical protein
MKSKIERIIEIEKAVKNDSTLDIDINHSSSDFGNQPPSVHEYKIEICH